MEVKNKKNKERFWAERKKLLCFLLSGFLCIVCLAGCKGTSPAGNTTETETFKVVTSFYPLYIMMMNLADGISGVEIVNMAQPQTGCLHDYQLRPGDLVCLEGADVFLANGGGMEDFLSDVLETYPDLPVLYALDGVDGSGLLSGGEHHHDHDHDVLSDAGEEVNPHTWMSISLYQEEITYIAAMLGEMDPVHQEAYEKNRADYCLRIDALSEDYAKVQEENKNDNKENGINCVLLHESFFYLAQDLGFSVHKSIDVEKDSGFSAKEIRTLIDEIKGDEGGLILSDSQYSGRIAGLLSEETGMRTLKLDSCVSGEYDKDAWINSMKRNLEELKHAAD